MRLTKLTLVAVLAFGWLQAPAAVRAEEYTPTRVRAILIGHTQDPSIGAGVSANLNMMERLVRGLPGFDPDTDLTVLKSNEALTPDNIAAAFKAMKVNKYDTVFCYIACHGAYDANKAEKDDTSKGHFFQLPSGDYKRADLLAQMKSKWGYQTVLISDTCNEAANMCEKENIQGATPATTAVYSPVFSSLLLVPQSWGAGWQVVDISGSSHGQSGWYNPSGGWFTKGMIETLAKLDEKAMSTAKALRPWDEADILPTFRSKEDAPVPHNSPYAWVGWQSFAEETSENVSAIFKARQKLVRDEGEPVNEGDRKNRNMLLAQADQRPQVFQNAWASSEKTSIEGTTWKVTTNPGLDIEGFPNGLELSSRDETRTFEFQANGRLLVRKNEANALPVERQWKQFYSVIVIMPQSNDDGFRIDLYSSTNNALKGSWLFDGGAATLLGTSKPKAKDVTFEKVSK